MLEDRNPTPIHTYGVLDSPLDKIFFKVIYETNRIFDFEEISIKKRVNVHDALPRTKKIAEG